MRAAFVGAHRIDRPDEEERLAPNAGFDVLAERAESSLNDHAIKFAVTLARMSDIAPADRRERALERWLTRIGA